MSRPHRRRPPWWPEDEPWPPRGRPPWARRRPPGPLLLILLLAALLLAALLLAAGLAVAGLVAASATRATGLVALVLALLLLAAILANRRQVARLARRARAAAAADERRRAFLADVTHELRTPLAVIRGEAEAIADGVHPAGPESLGRILDAAAALERLVADLGVLSAGDPGELDLRLEEVDVAQLVGETAASLQAGARAAGVELATEVAPGLPPARLDPVRIRGVLVNLAGNAFRYTAAGGRVVIAAAAAPGGLELSVRDNGSGVDPDLLPRIFERFAKDAASPGSGLGLAIARQVVEAHGGRLEVVSRPGEGALFKAFLPA